MGKGFITRRAFLGSVQSSVGKSVILLSAPAIIVACRDAQQARLSGAAFQNLNENEAQEFDAIASLSNGCMHGPVYSKLESARRREKADRAKIWEDQDVF